MWTRFTWLAAGLLWVLGAAHASEPSEQRQRQLIHMLKHDCGSCHGLTLNGGLGPELTGTALAGKPDEVLRQTILRGRPGTPMPPFAGLLSVPEIDWLIGAMRNGSDSDD